VVYFNFNNYAVININTGAEEGDRGDLALEHSTEKMKERMAEKREQAVIRFNGYIYGDGHSSSKVYCIHKSKIPEETVTKCLFKIEPPKKFFTKKQMDERGNQSSEVWKAEYERWKQELNDEEEDYQHMSSEMEGVPISFGQNCLLRHLFSNCFLTFQPDKIAKLIGNIQVGLTTEGNHFSSVRLMPSSKVKQIGEYISYQDSLVVASAANRFFNLHVSEFIGSHDQFLEVNGSELHTEWRPNFYTDNARLLSMKNVVAPGEVIQIFNTSDIGGYLAARMIPIERKCQTRKLVSRGGYQHKLSSIIPLEFTYLSSELENQFSLYISHSKNYFTMWEVQRVLPFDSVPPEYYSPDRTKETAIRLKNIACQCYLCCDPDDSSVLILTKHGMKQENIFYFSSKSTVGDNSWVGKGDFVKLLNCKGKFVQPMKIQPKPGVEANKGAKVQSPRILRQLHKGLGTPKRELGSEEIDLRQSHLLMKEEYNFGCSNKSDLKLTNFEINESPNDFVVNQSKLKSMFNLLYRFYSYFQNWSIEPVDSSSTEPLVYSFSLATETEKELENEVQILMECLENMFTYLTQEDIIKYPTYHQKDDELKRFLQEKISISVLERKKLMMEQNIFEILFLLLELLEFKTIGSLRGIKEHQDEKDREKDIDATEERRPNTYSKLREDLEKNKELFDYLPQIMARSRLEKTFSYIFKILYIFAQKNPHGSRYLSTKVDFYQNLLEFYPNEIIDLAGEIAKNLQAEHAISTKFFKIWTTILFTEPMSERGDNIAKHVKIVKILANLAIDRELKKAKPDAQTSIFSLIFQDKFQFKGMGLVKFHIHKDPSRTSDTIGTPQVVFLTHGSKLILTKRHARSNSKNSTLRLPTLLRPTRILTSFTST
jgi:hypothetical protein